MKLSLSSLFTIILFYFSLNTTQAQQYTLKDFYKIDSLAYAEQPKLALALIEKINSQAREKNDAQLLIKSVIYRMLFQSYLEEDSFYKIVTDLRKDVSLAQQPEKSILQSLLAELYWKYYLSNLYTIRNRTAVQADTGDDIRTWSPQKLTEEIGSTYLLSVSETNVLQRTKIDLYSKVLTGDSLNRAFRSTLYDVLMHRAIDVLSNTQLNVSSFDTNDANSHATSLKLLDDLLKFNRENINASADVELKKLKISYQRENSLEVKEAYVKALGELAKTYIKSEVYADILFEQANLISGQSQFLFDTKKFDLIEAFNLATRAAKAYPQSTGGKNSANLVTKLKQASLNLQLKTQIIPQEPTPIHFSYKNVDSIYLRVYKVATAHQYVFNDAKNFNDFFKKNVAIKKWVVVVPKAIDYQTHTLVDKMSGLPKGKYIIFAQHTNADNNDTKYAYTQVVVSNLAVTERYLANGEHEYRVANFKNGHPIKNVTINQRAKRLDLDTVTTNEFGFVSSKQSLSINSALVSYKKDSLLLNVYDDRSDEDEPTTRVLLFTDRPIYRPGQTLYYKGFILKSSQDKQHILPSQSLDLTFNDVNHKAIEKTSVTSNDFGTFQGSFIIPIGKLNGRMELNTSFGSVTVQVEEYKRPTFEVNFDKSNQSSKLADSIPISGKAIAYAGYAVTNAKVKFTIFQQLIQNNLFSRIYQPKQQIAFGQATTSKNGEFDFKFAPILSPLNANYNFEIKVDVTDETGETISSTKSITSGKNDISIVVGLSSQLFLNSAQDSISVTVANLNNEPIQANVNVEWSLLTPPNRLTHSNLLKAEHYALSKAEFSKSFPTDEYMEESDPLNWPVKQVQLNKSMAINGRSKIGITAAELPVGYYRVKFLATTLTGDTLSSVKLVRVYGAGKSVQILTSKEWLVAEKTMIRPSESAVFWIAGLRPNSKAYYEVYHKNDPIEKVWLTVSPTLQRIEIKSKPNFENDFAVQFTMIQEGKIYNQLEQVYIFDDQKTLEIKFLTFRNKLLPGEKENWKLRISTRGGEPQAAELMATLFDASLEKLFRLDWYKSFQSNFNYNSYNWKFQTNQINSGNQLWFMGMNQFYYPLLSRTYENFDWLGYAYHGAYNNGFHSYIRVIEEAKKSSQKLAELQKGNKIFGLITVRGSNLPATGITITNGSAKAVASSNGIYEIEAKEGDILTFTSRLYNTLSILVGKYRRHDINLSSKNATLNESLFTPNTTRRVSISDAINKNFNTVTIRGTNSSNEVVLSGVSSPSFQAKEVRSTTTATISPRINFSESAFFYPQLRTNKDGEIDIEFTIPQSLTRYKMVGLAHTKDLKTARVTRELITQKQLAVSINAPRFLRTGDTIVWSAKLQNLAGTALKGEAILELRDALTEKVINLKPTQATQSFDLENNGNAILKWTLIIPNGITAITYKVVAQSGNFSDGEEMTIPVLPNSILVTETMPITLSGKSSKTFTMDHLVKSSLSKTLSSESLTLEFTANPLWYAIQALPYLVEYPYDCAEQIFSKFYANSFATKILNSSPKIKAIFKQWEQTNTGNALLSNLEKNQELKSILIEETPWVRDAEDETSRKKRLAVVFDLNRMSYELKGNLEKLEKMQNENGSFSWFKGMNEDRYITQHIVLGMGQLHKLKLVDEASAPNFEKILSKATAYLDGKLVKDFTNKKEGYLPLHYLYARSYVDRKSVNPDFNKAFTHYVELAADKWRTMDVYQQAQASILLYRLGNRVESSKIINLLKQTAQQSEELGMYWANNRNGWYWHQNQVETQSLLIEAFNEVTGDKKAVAQMQTWLLRNKQATNWKTTKATVAACYALLMNNDALLSEIRPPDIVMGGKNMPIANAEAGTGYQKTTIVGTAIQPQMGKVQIKNNNNTTAWGALYWQYFEQLDRIKSSSSGVKIKKQLFLQKQNAKGNILTPITPLNVLVLGDVVKVRIEINADRDMEYMHLKDMRSSGFEPINIISQYKYQDGLGYYQSTKDASSNFFINYLKKGVYVFEYELRVSHAGNFANGITSLQSMYAPAYITISDGIRVTVNE